MPHGLLLINLGTPDEPTTSAVRRYLREFLGDPRVLDINAVGRALLLHLVILPRRPAKSAEAYRSIWDKDRGSPLLYHSQDVAAAVGTKLGDRWQVELAMRYGSPSIEAGLAALERAQVDRIVVLPLFPQYASSSTGSANARVMELAQARWNVPALDFVPAFFDDPGFLGAFAKVAEPVLRDFKQDHLLFSFHGLPVRQIEKTDTTRTHCFQSETCCDTLANPNCYRAQSFATARGIAKLLALPADGYTVCFQSRLGRTPWIQPYTDVLLDELPKRGIKRLAVMCPAFVADCLETLEEIGMRAKAQWKAAGGEDLVLVPSLNATAPWVDALVGMAERHAARKSLPTIT